MIIVNMIADKRSTRSSPFHRHLFRIGPTSDKKSLYTRQHQAQQPAIYQAPQGFSLLRAQAPPLDLANCDS